MMQRPKYSSIGQTTSLELNNNLTFDPTIDSSTTGPFFDSIRQDELKNTNLVYGPNDSHDVPSIDSFEEMGLMSQLLKNIRKRYGSSAKDAEGSSSEAQPTAVQCSVISYLLSENNSDLTIRSPTGSGKTGAFLIPMIQRIHDDKLQHRDPMDEDDAPSEVNGDSPFVIVLAPTRTLAIQIYKEAVELTKNTSVKVACAFGEFRRNVNIQMMRLGCDIVIGTMGRVFDFLLYGNKETDEGVLNSDNLKFVIMDEFDRLNAADGRFELKRLTTHQFFENVRVVALSASFDFDDRTSLLRSPAVINVKDDYPPICVVQKFVDVQSGKPVKCGTTTCRPTKFDFLSAFCRLKANKDRRLPRMIVFAITCLAAEYVTMRLLLEGYRAFSVHGRRSTDRRLHTIQRFKRGDFDVLVTTDGLARGLDFPEVEFVINYDLPRDRRNFVEYLHRVGRTGRAGHLGVALSFFDSVVDLEFVDSAIKVLKYYGEPIPEFLKNSFDLTIKNLMERAVAQAQSYVAQRGLSNMLTARHLPDAVEVLEGELNFF